MFQWFAEKAGSDRCKLPFKEEGDEELQEATADLFAAEEIGVHTALVIVLSKPRGIFFFFTLKEQRTSPKLLLPDSTGSKKKKKKISMLWMRQTSSLSSHFPSCLKASPISPKNYMGPFPDG